MTLGSLCRAMRPLVLYPAVSTRGVASLSGIHNGIRRSQRVDPQRPRRSDVTKQLTYRQRQEEREALKKEPTFKILKGKKDIKEHPGEARPQSRRARFFDPDSSFGKKSLVYQVKTGQVPEEIKHALDRKRQSHTEPEYAARSKNESRELGDIFSQKIRPHIDPGDDGVKPAHVRREIPGRKSRSFTASGSTARGARPSRAQEDVSSQRTSDQSSDRGRRTYEEPPRGVSRGAATTHHAPVSIPYTTAASQFLYGKSVVEAALRGGRRQLYKLYVFEGKDPEKKQRRGGLEKDEGAVIKRLAAAKGVDIVRLREDGLALMKKMSGGRPHNNYILEASPLPQLPVKALGPLSEIEEKPGFSISLGYQSAEEMALAGSQDFISTAASSHKPLIVLLDGVLDPGNLGAIIRSAGFLGATAVAIAERSSAPMSPVALKAAAGASEVMKLLSISAVEPFLAQSREAGWVVYAAVPPRADGRHLRPHMDMSEVETTDPLREKPCILVLGSEGEGLSASVKRQADFDVHIPNLLGSNMIDSLNVNVAAGLLCHAFLRGKSGEKAVSEEPASLF